VDPGIYHEQHPASWGGGLYAEYNGYLAALDAPYFSRWAHYVAALQAARAGARPLDRDRLRQQVFGRPLLRGLDRPRQMARDLRARLRYAWRRPRLVREAQ